MRFSSSRTIIAIVAFALSASSSFAGINLKSVQVSEGSQVDFLFDGKIEPGQVKTEFVREHIQLSLANVAVYPAKVNLIQGREMTKVFAYQFAPQVVRLRVSMKMDAEKYQNRLQVKTNGKVLTLKIDGADIVVGAQTAPATDSVKTAASAPARKDAPDSTNDLNAEEKKLLEPVLKKETLGRESKESKESKDGKESKISPVEAKSNRLTSGKNPVSPFRAIGTLLLVVGLFGVLVYFMKKFRQDASTTKGIKGFLGKLGANVGQKRLISVVATMSLGPKKSISVVRIQNRMLVLGMTNESVNLITEFRADEESPDGLGDSMNLKDFADGIRGLDEPAIAPAPAKRVAPVATETRRASIAPAEPRHPNPNAAGSRAVNSYLNARESRMPVYDEPAVPTSPAFQEVLKQENAKASVRAQIRSKLEGLKPL